MGSLEPFVADIWPDLPEGVCSVVTRPALGLAASGPLGCHGNHCAPMLAAAVSKERAQGFCWHDRMVWAAFLHQVSGLALVRSKRAKTPVPISDLKGYALW